MRNTVRLLRGNKMTIESETRNLLTSALLHFDPRIVDKRAALNCVLIEVALFENTGSCTSADVYERVNEYLGQKRVLSSEDYDRALNECLHTKTVLMTDGKYELSGQKHDIFRQVFNDVNKQMQQVKRQLIETVELEVGSILDLNVADRIYDAVIRVITEEVYDHSLQLAREKLSFEQMIEKIEEFDPQSKLTEMIDGCLPEDRKLLRQKILGGIINYLRDLSIELITVLKTIHHNVLLNQILSLDPAMIASHRRLFAGRRVYLDTNVILSFVLDAHSSHQAVKEILEASTNLGVQLLVSPYTIHELDGQVQRARNDYRSYERNDIVSAMAPYGDDVILATYLEQKKKQPALAWEPFIAQFSDWAELLLQYNILKEEDCVDAVGGHRSLGGVHNIVNDVKRHYASDNVVDHDTNNCVLILCVREKYPPDEMGQVVWLLTIDRSLKKVQKHLLSSKVTENPYCMQISSWGEIVMPVQNVLGFVFNDFIGYLAQARLGALVDPHVIQLDFLETIRNAEVDVDRLMNMRPQQVKQILGSLQSNRDAHLILERAAAAQTLASKRALQLEFQPILEQAVAESDPIRNMQIDFDRKINLLNEHLNLRDETIVELNQQINKIESSTLYRVWKWIKNLFGKS